MCHPLLAFKFIKSFSNLVLRLLHHLKLGKLSLSSRHATLEIFITCTLLTSWYLFNFSGLTCKCAVKHSALEYDKRFHFLNSWLSILTANKRFMCSVSRHRTLMNIFDKAPNVEKDAFVAPSASVIGDVQVGRGSSIWYGCVLRGVFLFNWVNIVDCFS